MAELYAGIRFDGGNWTEKWVRWSPAQLRRKEYGRIQKTRYGVMGWDNAQTLAQELLDFTNVEEVTAKHVGGGMWEVTDTVLTEEWTDDYKAG